MTVLPCTPEHLRAIDSISAPESRRVTLQNLDESPGVALVLEEFARTLEIDGVVAACFGVWPMWPRVARAWSDLSELALRHPKTLHAAVRSQLAEAQEAMVLARVEAVVKSDFAAGVRWVEHLGFEREGTMRNYGIDGVGDYDLYARSC